MTYAVKVTSVIWGMEFEHYVGLRGEVKHNINKVEGWKKYSTAEKKIEELKHFDEWFGSQYEKDYEIITL